MNDFDRLLQKVLTEAKAVGVPVSDHIDSHITINKRAKQRFGRCNLVGKKYTIELSEMLLTAPEFSCCQTIAHELIHTCQQILLTKWVLPDSPKWTKKAWQLLYAASAEERYTEFRVILPYCIRRDTAAYAAVDLLLYRRVTRSLQQSIFCNARSVARK